MYNFTNNQKELSTFSSAHILWVNLKWKDFRFEPSVLPLNDITNLLKRVQEFAEVLCGAGAPSGSGTDLQLSQTSLQLVDGLSEGKLVSHLLDGIHIAGAELGEVISGLQDSVVAACLFRVAPDSGTQELSTLQDHLTRDVRDTLCGLSRLPQ